MGPVTLKTFTLNCWTVPFTSEDTPTRVLAIGRYLAESDYDIVFLQEVWSRKWFSVIEEECKSRFPHSRCFFSGRVGTSGLCIFSRFPIVDTFFHQFMLNGYWYAILHGDNHGCKGAGFVRVMVDDFPVNCFISHFHAQYDRQNDPYFAHRVSQAYELLKFADMIVPSMPDSSQRSLTIIAGDLNLEPHDLGVQLLQYGGFTDSWQVVNKDKFVPTCDHKENRYTPKSSLQLFPTGKRIDYIMYRTQNVHCEVVDSSILGLKVPNTDMPLSDHEAVITTFKLTFPEKRSIPSVQSLARLRKIEDECGQEDLLQQLNQLFKQSTKDCAISCRNWIYMTVAVIFVGIVALFFAPCLMNKFTGPIYIFTVVFFVLHYLLAKRLEHIHLSEIASQVQHDLNARQHINSASKC